MSEHLFLIVCSTWKSSDMLLLVDRFIVQYKVPIDCRDFVISCIKSYVSGNVPL